MRLLGGFLLSLGGLLGAVFPTSADTVLFDRFVSSEDNDLQSQFHLEGNYVALPDGGVSGGSVGAGDGTGRATFHQTLPFDPGSQLSTSVLFKYSLASQPQLPGVPPGEGIITRLGLVKEATQGLIFLTPANGLFAEIGSIAGGGIQQLGVNLSDQGGSIGPVISKPLQAPLLDGHWYRLGLRVDYLSPLFYSTRATLEDFGTTGTSPQQEVDAVETSFANAPEFLVDGLGLYAGWAGYWHVSHFDNFSATSIPEPGAIPLLVLGAIGLWLRTPRSNPRSRSTSGFRPSFPSDRRPDSR